MDSAENLHHQARLAYAAGHLSQAISLLQQAAQHDPNRVEIWNDLGLLLRQSGQVNDGIEALKKAVAIGPSTPEPYANLGNALRSLGQLDDAIDSYQQSLNIQPRNAVTLNNLAASLLDTGKVDQAIDLGRKAIQIDPHSAQLHSNLLYALHFSPNSTPASVLKEHQKWAQIHAPLPPKAERKNSLRKKIRVGYLSPDFYHHVIGRFLLPILQNHNRDKFEIFAYSNLATPPDEMTDALRRSCDHWRDIAPLSDEKAANQIREDEIDLLIDLTMHMARNRLGVFAQHPAAVQATYLAYPSTTGMPQIDYRLTDPHLDPPGTDAHYVERSLRLDTYWCYKPPPQAEQPVHLRSGHIVFGCLNNFRKVSPDVLETWHKILQQLPNSRMILHCAEGSHRQTLAEKLCPQKVQFAGPMSLTDYFQTYSAIDIALDPFPYAGGTTTLDAAYSGVPTVTLAGTTAVGRGGVSINMNLALPDLVAHSPEEYIKIALKFATDRDQLTDLRKTLRQRMRDSLLMNQNRFIQNLEERYEEMLLGTLGFEPRTKEL